MRLPTAASVAAPAAVRGRKLLWLAATLGAVLGSFVAARFAAACDCSPWSWRLQLVDVSGALDDAALWPVEASLEARPGTVIITSIGMATPALDRVHAGTP